MGCPYVAAGQVVELVDFGAFSGSWFVKTATHKISGSGGYSTSLELSAPAPTEEESAHGEISEAALAANAQAAPAPGSAIDNLANAIASAAGSLINAAGQFVMDAAGNLVNESGNILVDALGNIMDAGGNLLVDASGNILDATGQIATSPAGQLLRAAKNLVVDAAGNVISSPETIFKDDAGNILDAAGNLLVDASGRVLLYASGYVLDAAGNILTDMAGKPVKSENVLIIDAAHNVLNAAAGVKAALQEAELREGAQTAGVNIYSPGYLPMTENATSLLNQVTDKVEEFAIQAQKSGNELEKEQARIDSAILCVADIAEAEAARSGGSDKKGWLYLRDMLLKWLSAKANENGEYQEPFIVDWDWVLSYERAQKAYNEFVAVDPYEKQTIFNVEAQKSLGDILFNNKKDPAKKETLAQILSRRTRWEGDKLVFDFINTPWDEWEALYYTLRPVDGYKFEVDGLTATLNTFSFRALANGYAMREGAGWLIYVEKIAVFVHDIFNFEDSGSAWKDALGCWDCDNLAFYGTTNGNEPCLNNANFRAFRDKYKTGADYLVLSLPHMVETFKGGSYVYF